MLRQPLRWAYRLLGRRYPRILIAVQLQFSHLVAAGGCLLLKLYLPEMDNGTFWRIFLVCQALSVLENLLAYRVISRLIGPADAWLRGRRDAESAIRAWRALSGLPLRFVRYRGLLPVVLNIVPISVYLALELDQGFMPEFLVLMAGSAVVLLYGLFLRFFAIELILRPVLEHISVDIPDGSELGRTTLSLKWRLMIALPAMNIITGVIAVGLSSPDEGLRTLGIGVLVTIAIAFTISLELSVLVLRSILEPLQDLRRGTERVKRGDLSVRVPVLGSDETGLLAGSFNSMVTGLAEREKLREAFGAFVDPVLADRVLEEGTVIEGQEVEVSVLFLDVRGFTAFAERSSAREVVRALNDLYEVAVPILVEHGGHANSFVGDGLLGVFGAPDRQWDHADRAVACALELAAVVRERGGELSIGIGVNSGPVVAGTVGGGGRVKFTVIGDPVNTAARVEAFTRETGDGILVTEATRCLLRRDHGKFVARGAVELRGRREPVHVHAPVAVAAATGRTPLPSAS